MRIFRIVLVNAFGNLDERPVLIKLPNNAPWIPRNFSSIALYCSETNQRQDHAVYLRSDGS